MTKASAFYQFWSSFGISAFEENAVPDNAVFPYITYDAVFSSWGATSLVGAAVWYRSTSWVECNAKTQEISEAIGLGGKLLHCDGGAIWLKREENFAQPLAQENDDMVKRMVLTLSAEYITEN